MNTIACNSATHERLLNGLWDFSFLGDVDPDRVPEPSSISWKKVMVPSAFDALLKTQGKRGLALYRRELPLPAGQDGELWFGALSMWSRVYVDGELLRENACGYEPLRVRVPASPSEKRELLVVVDNRFDFERVPMHEEYFDFYQYGGILREVKLRLLPRQGPWIQAVRVTPTEEYRAGKVTVDVMIEGEQGDGLQIMAGFDGEAPRVVSAAPGVIEGGLRVSLTVPAPRLWSPDEPNLHGLEIALDDGTGTIIDRRCVRFGLRRIEAREARLWLNGEPLILKGYNRHEWHPSVGPCTPPPLMFEDIELMKDLGCNFVRGSHYPQDQRFLDLCDELGLLVWEENLGWGQREKTFASEKFVRDHRQSLISMVHESYNHPSIICWGFLNEAGSDSAYSRAVFEESAALLRELDPSRLVTYATMFPLTDLHYDLVDLISINTYPGWYACESVADPVSLIKPRLEALVASVDERGFKDKPVMISEIGAEALYGWRDGHNDFFTESYQARYLATALEGVLDNPRYSGISLWLFSDTRTYSGGFSLMRPRTYNNKGTLDEYRRPKEAYAVVKRAFTGGC